MIDVYGGLEDVGDLDGDGVVEALLVEHTYHAIDGGSAEAKIVGVDGAGLRARRCRLDQEDK